MNTITTQLNLRTVKKLILLFALGFFIISCSSDDDSSSNDDNQDTLENYFTYDGQTYELKDGFIESYIVSEINDGYNSYFVELNTSKLVERSNNDPAPEENIFSTIDFTLYSPDENSSPMKGNYDHIAGGQLGDHTLAFEEGGVAINENFDTNDYGELGEVSHGTLEVLHSKNPFEVKFYFVMFNGKELKGHFKGELIKIDGDE